MQEDQIRSSIISVFSRSVEIVKSLSAGSLMALVTAAGFLPLFPVVGSQLGLDPQFTLWLGNIGTNILANWIQQFYEAARQNPPKDQDELLERLNFALQAQITESADFRSDAARFIDRTRAVEAAQEAFQGRETAQAWFFVNIYTELIESRQSFSDQLSRVEEALGVLGYKVDVLLHNLPQIRRIASTIPEAEQQVKQFEVILMLPRLWPAMLPSTEPYYALPERDNDLEKLLGVLRDPKGRRIVAIDGLGGLGKTATAVEIGRRCLSENMFERVVGESAKQERLVSGVIEKISGAPAKLGFDELLNSIARQLGRWDVPTMKMEEKKATLRYLLEQSSYLVIVDNLETVDNASSLVMELQTLLDRSRAILTSRIRLDLDFVYPLSLKGLSELDTFVFLKADAKSRNCPEIQQAGDRELRRIHKVTGGAPLALKLVVGQVSKLPLRAVLENLEKSKGDIYRFIYLESWNLLSAEAQKLLLYMGTVGNTCGYEELASAGITEDEENLQKAIDEAIGLSLLNASETIRQKRYSIHALTRHFVNSELPDIWKAQGLF